MTTPERPKASEFYRDQVLPALFAGLSSHFPDMEVSGRTDKKNVVELLKMILGNDSLTIDQKHLAEIKDHQLRTRIMCVVNQMPSLPDATSALMRRSLCFHFRNPVSEDERDLRLEDKLKTARSLAGILLLAICGLYDLEQDGGFT